MTSPHEPSHAPCGGQLWRCLYIAKDHDGEMLGIILAPSYQAAYAFFLGSGTTPHSVEVIDPCNAQLGDPVTGICIVALARPVHVDYGQINILQRT